jgi:hypothetical protein
VGVAILFDPAEQAAASSENVRLFLLLVVSGPSLSLRTCLRTCHVRLNAQEGGLAKGKNWFLSDSQGSPQGTT